MASQPNHPTYPSQPGQPTYGWSVPVDQGDSSSVFNNKSLANRQRPVFNVVVQCLLFQDHHHHTTQIHHLINNHLQHQQATCTVAQITNPEDSAMLHSPSLKSPSVWLSYGMNELQTLLDHSTISSI